MVDRMTWSRRLDALKGYLGKLRSYQVVPEADFVADWTVHDTAERNLHLAIECLLDMAQHYIAEEGLRLPQTNRDAFTVLREAGRLDSGLADRLEGWAGLRNLLVHAYLNIDHAKTFAIIRDELGDLEEFLAWATDQR